MEPADVLLHQLDLGYGDVQLGGPGEFEGEVLLGAPLAAEGFEPLEPGDAVVDVDDVVAGFHIDEGVGGAAGGVAADPADAAVGLVPV